jgi:hypothetical protein
MALSGVDPSDVATPFGRGRDLYDGAFDDNPFWGACVAHMVEGSQTQDGWVVLPSLPDSYDLEGMQKAGLLTVDEKGYQLTEAAIERLPLRKPSIK